MSLRGLRSKPWQSASLCAGFLVKALQRRMDCRVGLRPPRNDKNGRLSLYFAFVQQLRFAANGRTPKISCTSAVNGRTSRISSISTINGRSPRISYTPTANGRNPNISCASAVNGRTSRISSISTIDGRSPGISYASAVNGRNPRISCASAERPRPRPVLTGAAAPFARWSGGSASRQRPLRTGRLCSCR